ncbi:MAG: hypothetical protein Q8R64_13780 [Sulfurimicrobium sp.]|nr:hypothetical protein [Sulfurimicrobium sp.]
MPQDRSTVELVTIYEISKVLSSSLDLHKTLQGVMNLLSSYLPMRRGMLSLLQEDDELHVVAATTWSSPSSCCKLSMPRRMCRWVESRFSTPCRVFCRSSDELNTLLIS